MNETMLLLYDFQVFVSYALRRYNQLEENPQKIKPITISSGLYLLGGVEIWESVDLWPAAMRRYYNCTAAARCK